MYPFYVLYKNSKILINIKNIILILYLKEVIFYV